MRRRSGSLGVLLPLGTICLSLAIGILYLGCWPLAERSFETASLPEVSAEAAPVEETQAVLQADSFLPRLHRPVAVSAHRGDSMRCPENTLPAFEKAISEQADWVELDVQASADGELIVFHDNSLYRLAGIGRHPGDCSLEELNALDVGAWKGQEYQGTRIPLLREVLELCRDRVRVNVEIKETARTLSNPITLQVVQTIQDCGMSEQCMITAYMHSTLEQIRLLDPSIKTALLCETADRVVCDAPEVDAFSVWAPLVTSEMVEEANLAGKKVIAWPVDTPEELERLAGLGIDIVIAQDPAGTLELLYGPEGLYPRHPPSLPGSR